MGKTAAKKGRHRAKKLVTVTKLEPAKKVWKFFRWLVAVVLGLATLYVFLPRPTVSLETPLDPNDVLTTPVVISNDGLLAIYDVDIATYALRIDRLRAGTEVNDIVGTYQVPSRVIEAGKRRTVPLNDLAHDVFKEIQSADVALIVSYKPVWFLPWTKYAAFRFTTAEEFNGHLRLQQQPEGDVIGNYKLALKIASKVFGLPH